jgi:hypothetical protein
MSEKLVAEVKQLLRIHDKAAIGDESRGEVIARLTGRHVTDDAMIATMLYISDREQPGLLGVPGVFAIAASMFAFGAALAAHHHKSKNQESENGRKGQEGGVCKSGEGSGDPGRT